jgi:hypothetical protein
MMREARHHAVCPALLFLARPPIKCFLVGKGHGVDMVAHAALSCAAGFQPYLRAIAANLPSVRYTTVASGHSDPRKAPEWTGRHCRSCICGVDAWSPTEFWI